MGKFLNVKCVNKFSDIWELSAVLALEEERLVPGSGIKGELPCRILVHCYLTELGALVAMAAKIVAVSKEYL